MPCLRRPIPAARRHTSRRASSPASRARRHRGAALRPRQAPIGRASSSPFPFPLVARLSAGLWVCVHHENVLEMAEVHCGNEDRALEGPVLAFGDLNDLTEDQAFRIERFQVISDREPRGDDDVADLHVLGLKDPVVLERELVDPRLKGVVVGPEVLDLGDRLPEPAGGGAELAEDTFSGHQKLGYKGGAGADEGRVTEEEQSEGDDEKPGEGPEEGVPRAWGAPRAPKSGHGPYLTRQTLVCL